MEPVHTIALQELEHLREAISRHEDHAFKTRAWLFTTLGALTLGLLGRRFSPGVFATLGYLLVALFLVVESLHRSVMRYGIRRFTHVEACLRRGGTGYDGPLVSESQGQTIPLQVMWEEMTIRLVWVPYIVAIVAVFLLTYWVATGRITTSFGTPLGG